MSETIKEELGSKSKWKPVIVYTPGMTNPLRSGLPPKLPSYASTTSLWRGERLVLQQLVSKDEELNEIVCGLDWKLPPGRSRPVIDFSALFFDKNFEYTYNGGQSFENENKTEITKISGDTCFQKILGSAMLIEKKLFLEVGMFNENMFLFFSDYDLCKKIKKLNKSVIQIRSAISIHTHGKSKVKNVIKRIFLKEFNMTYDQLYYFYINKLENTLLNKLKKQQFNYLFKIILNLIIFKFDKSVHYYSKIIAYYKFIIKN